VARAVSDESSRQPFSFPAFIAFSSAESGTHFS
jgi:hypothetical protein